MRIQIAAINLQHYWHITLTAVVDCVWNVMAHAQKPYLVFQRNGRVHLNRRGWGGGGQFSRLLAAEVCASAVVMLDTPCSEVVWRYWLPTPFASSTSIPAIENRRENFTGSISYMSLTLSTQRLLNVSGQILTNKGFKLKKKLNRPGGVSSVYYWQPKCAHQR